MLASSERQAALQAAERFRDDRFLVYHDEKTGGNPVREPFPTGKQAVPITIPSGTPMGPRYSHGKLAKKTPSGMYLGGIKKDMD